MRSNVIKLCFSKIQSDNNDIVQAAATNFLFLLSLVILLLLKSFSSTLHMRVICLQTEKKYIEYYPYFKLYDSEKYI